MITRYKYQPKAPCSLHDMTVDKIECREKTICVHFKDGWSRQPYPQGEENITIEGVDFDAVSVLLLSKNGEYGDFEGQKLSLQDFLKNYTNFILEIIDDKYGYNSVEYSGYLYLELPNDNRLTIEMIISIYHFGDIIYDMKE